MKNRLFIITTSNLVKSIFLTNIVVSKIQQFPFFVKCILNLVQVTWARYMCRVGRNAVSTTTIIISFYISETPFRSTFRAVNITKYKNYIAQFK